MRPQLLLQPRVINVSFFSFRSLEDNYASVFWSLLFSERFVWSEGRGKGVCGGKGDGKKSEVPRG